MIENKEFANNFKIWIWSSGLQKSTVTILGQSKPARPTNKYNGRLPLLRIDHPQKEGKNSMENQGNLNTLNFAQAQ